LVRVIEIGLTHKPYTSNGVFKRNCNQQYCGLQFRSNTPSEVYGLCGSCLTHKPYGAFNVTCNPQYSEFQVRWKIHRHPYGKLMVGACHKCLH
jgi:hypothetical protein